MARDMTIFMISNYAVNFEMHPYKRRRKHRRAAVAVVAVAVAAVVVAAVAGRRGPFHTLVMTPCCLRRHPAITGISAITAAASAAAITARS